MDKIHLKLEPLDELDIEERSGKDMQIKHEIDIFEEPMKIEHELPYEEIEIKANPFEISRENYFGKSNKHVSVMVKKKN